jgi:hypothetical protein
VAAKTYYERRSFRNALKTYLESKGWPTDLRYEEGFQTDAAITTPLVAIHFLPSEKRALQLAPMEENTYRRTIQVDCYMESEPRAMAICDDIMDFMDLIAITILNENAVNLGTLICFDTESINSEILPPNLGNPKVIRWRGVIRGGFEAHYP